METKLCKACLEEKELCEFNKKSENKDGYSNKCRVCTKNKVEIPTDKIEEGFKKCTYCKVILPIDCFYKNKALKCGLTSDCKNCNNFRKKERYKINKEDILAKNREWYLNNSEFKIQYSKDYYNKNRDVLKEKSKLYRSNNKDLVKEQQKKSYDKNKEKYIKNNVEYQNKRKRLDTLYKLRCNIRSLILKTMGDSKEGNKSEDILGCSWRSFKNHIESQFLSWMTWENYGNVCEQIEYNCSWDLDHIIPISSANTEEEIYLLNHWSNFQPLCSYVNRNIKRDSIYPVTNLELNITKI
jgi:hypothetical protein